MSVTRASAVLMQSGWVKQSFESCREIVLRLNIQYKNTIKLVFLINNYLFEHGIYKNRVTVNMFNATTMYIMCKNL